MREPSEERIALYEGIEAFLRERQIAELSTEVTALNAIGSGGFEVTGDEFAETIAGLGVEGAADSGVQGKVREGYNRWAQARQAGLMLLPCYERRDGDLIRVYQRWSIRPISAAVPTFLTQGFELRGKAAHNEAERLRGLMKRAAAQVSPAAKAIADITVIGLEALTATFAGQAEAVLHELCEGNVAKLQAAARSMKLAHYNYQMALEDGTVEAVGDYTNEVARIAAGMITEDRGRDSGEAA